MRSLSTDVAIIGAGTAGLSARREVERAGKRALLIEQGPYGTTCARTGCMPSKLLIAAAEAARAARRASLFGVRIPEEAVVIDGAAVLARVRRERDRFARLSAQTAESLPAAERLHGTARFVGPSALMVGDTRVEAHAIVIATGSTPIVPKELAPLGALVLTTDTLFELETLPDSLAVFGTGAIGLELGQALHHLGVRVAFYNPFDVLGPFTDPRVDERLRALLTAELDLSLAAQIVAVQVERDGVLIRHRDGKGRAHERRFARVLAAVGRAPALASLDLARAGISLRDKGEPDFDEATRRCGDSCVYIAGDADGDRPLLHEAVDEGAIAGANAASHPNVTRHERRAALQIAFTHPQLALIGLSFKEASQRDIAIGESSYDDQGRARVIGQNRGTVRVYAERETGVLLGAELFGPGVEHTAHLLAWSVQQRLSISALLRMPVYHPTLEEGIRTALRDVAHKLAVLDDCPPEDRGDGPGA